MMNRSGSSASSTGPPPTRRLRGSKPDDYNSKRTSLNENGGGGPNVGGGNIFYQTVLTRKVTEEKVAEFRRSIGNYREGVPIGVLVTGTDRSRGGSIAMGARAAGEASFNGGGGGGIAAAVDANGWGGDDTDDTWASDDPSFHRPEDISHFYHTPLVDPRGRGKKQLFTRKRINGEPVLPTRNYFPTEVPNNVLELIFSHLNKRDLIAVMTTCKRNYDMGSLPCFWAFANIGNKFITQDGLHALLDRRIIVLRLNSTTVNIPRTPLPHGIGSRTMSNKPVELRYLDLGQASYSQPSILLHLLERCHNLVGLCLERCEVIDDQICMEIAKNTGLRFLDLSLAKGLTPNGIFLIHNHCGDLQELNLAWAHHTDETVRTICSSLPASLKKLNFSGTCDLAEMNDESVALLCGRCPQLEELDLSDGLRITEAAVATIRQKLRKLKVLSLARCYAIEPMEFLTLKHLHELNVQGCITDDSVAVLVQRLHRVGINQSVISNIAHPTTGLSVTSIWGQRTRDWY